MRAGTCVTLGIAAYLVFLATMVPASYVAAQLQGAARGLEITDASGTIWRGEARVRSVVGRTVLTVDKIRWSWLPSRLLQGEVAYRVTPEIPRFGLHFELARSFNGWTIRNLEGAGDARALTDFAPLLSIWKMDGLAKLSASSVALRGNTLEGDARIEVRQVTTALSEVKPLGAYEAVWKAGRFEVRTLEGPLRIAGKGTAALGSGFAFSGEARADPGLQAPLLEPLLDLMGPRRPDGARAIELRTQ